MLIGIGSQIQYTQTLLLKGNIAFVANFRLFRKLDTRSTQLNHRNNGRLLV